MKKILKITNEHFKLRNGKHVIVGCEVNKRFMFTTDGFDGTKKTFSFSLN